MTDVTTEMRTYPSGVPCWIDTEQPDVAAATRFYGELFGWTFVESPDAAPASTVARLDGCEVAGLAPASASPTTVPPAVWNTYVAVADLDATLARVTALGGEVTSAPTVGPAGESAAFVDRTGASLRLWRPGTRLGAQRVNVAGAWNFSDLHTARVSDAISFYERVFGWEVEASGAGPETATGPGAVMWRRPGYGEHLAATVDPDIRARHAAMGAAPGYADAVAWLIPATAGDSGWQVTFAVDDRDAAVATACRLGARVVDGPSDTAWTATTRLADPQGAAFNVSQFRSPA